MPYGVGAGPGSAQSTARQAWRLPVPGRRRERSLHREGEIPAAARPLVLPEDDRRAGADPAASGARRRRRGDRHGQRGRGAPPRAEPRQAAPAAVQRPPPRRQVVPVHRGHGGGRIPASDVHARAPPSRRLVLRPVREREEGAGDARRPQPRLPLPAVRGAEAGTPLGHPVPRLPHRPLPRAVRRLRLARGLPRDHRRRDRVPLRQRAADPARAGGEDAGGGAARSASRTPPATGTGCTPYSISSSGRRSSASRSGPRT